MGMLIEIGILAGAIPIIGRKESFIRGVGLI